MTQKKNIGEYKVLRTWSVWNVPHGVSLTRWKAGMESRPLFCFLVNVVPMIMFNSVFVFMFCFLSLFLCLFVFVCFFSGFFVCFAFLVGEGLKRKQHLGVQSFHLILIVHKRSKWKSVLVIKVKLQQKYEESQSDVPISVLVGHL